MMSKTQTPPVKEYTWNNRPPGLKTPNQLHKYNLKPGNAEAKGCIWHRGDSQWVLLYSPEECVIDDPTLPPYREYGTAPELKTKRQLSKENLAVKAEAKPRGFFRVWNSEESGWATILLYHPDDCEWSSPDNYLCKLTLRTTYLLSERWIKRIGEPDRVCDNPYYRSRAPMLLYSRQRVEKFLADNAEEYAIWLDKRDRYVVQFELNREAIERGRASAIQEREASKAKRREQMALCLNCKSGCALNRGFFCAIHPMGLDDSLTPCPDWLPKNVPTP